MKVHIEMPICEVCGAPATCAVQDIVCKRAIDGPFVINEPDGEPHHFCEKHKRDSHVRDEKPTHIDLMEYIKRL